ncbi:uroporphyrinogen-III C-methyltransferase [Reichenbachiella sp. MALMAid0571]|uniref:uroporphyrinogen-III C-methyltransferase n=1 Tax=Reichenbachiella sp. MALMAid0571 TaxID=3143939 RepID=UPI0032DEC8E3
MNKPKLILVGAGPGDEELITLKGVNALKSADVVLYDALANDLLLKYCKPDVKLVYVGKRAGLHYQQQQEINQMIVQYALEYGTVVRLKGGDPFVFGRGHEEKDHALLHGLEVEIVPGISSAIAVPVIQNIPITKRGVNESFWVITGTTKEDTLSKDMHLAAQSSATVIILMGMKKLASIIELFKKYRGEDEPIAVIMNGTCENEKSGFGKISTIESIVTEKELASPSVIVIGEVVKYGSETLKGISSKYVAK